MLVLTRNEGESICIGGNITVRFLEQRGRRIRLGIDAPGDVSVYRTEVTELPDFHDSRTKAKPAAAPSLVTAANANPTGSDQ